MNTTTAEEKEDFALRIRTRREELDLSQKEVSERLGIRQQTVSRWENGDAIPRPRRVHELAGLLQIPARTLQVLAGHLDQGLETANNRNETLDRISAKFHELTDDNQQTVEALIDALRNGQQKG